MGLGQKGSFVAALTSNARIPVFPFFDGALAFLKPLLLKQTLASPDLQGFTNLEGLFISSSSKANQCYFLSEYRYSVG